MEPVADAAPLVAIVGETASGKSELAIKLARQFNGEIIAADSRTFYRGMDIGTAKPTRQQREAIPHHLIDIATPDKPVSVAMFQQLALRAINDISGRGKLSIIVGGSGLYVDAVLFNYKFQRPPDMKLRQELQQLSVVELRSRLRERGIPLPTNPQNPRHLQRALETGGINTGDCTLRDNTLVIGLGLDREVLKNRIEERVERMLKQGLEQEVRGLADRYGWDMEPLRTIGYQEFQPYFQKQIGLKEVKERIIKNTHNYAKRQRTWFRRNKSIHWINNTLELNKAIDLMTTLLNK